MNFQGNNIGQVKSENGDIYRIANSSGTLWESGPLVIEDWESGQIGPTWTANENTNPSIVTDHTFKGTYSMFNDEAGKSPPSFIYSFEGDGLPYYPQFGDTLRARFRYSTTTGGFGLAFGFDESDGDSNQDINDNSITGRYVPGNNTMNFSIDGSLEAEQQDIDASQYTDEWLIFEYEWGSTTYFRMFEENGNLIHELSSSNSSLDRPGRSIAATYIYPNDHPNAWIDYIHVEQ